MGVLVVPYINKRDLQRLAREDIGVRYHGTRSLLRKPVTYTERFKATIGAWRCGHMHRTVAAARRCRQLRAL